MLTKQELFNKMYLGLASQNWERSGYGDVCNYRDRHGRKCAVGWLIPDEKYNPKWEGKTPGGQLSNDDLYSEFWDAIQVKVEDDDMIEFLTDCQLIHDGAGSPENMHLRFKAYASKNNLEIPNAA